MNAAAIPRSRLQVAGLACARGHATLFKDVSFEIDAGDWIAVRGPNGSGKTTLIRCVAGLTRADRGEVSWKGRRVREDPEGFHADLLYAGHLAGIKDDLSAEENLRGLLKLRAQDAGPEAVRAALAEAGLDKRRHLPARRLSAGQRRRIGLARLLLDSASCWLLDEPLTALDDAGQQLFARALRNHLDRGGLALVATHHDLPVAGARELRLA